MSFPSVQLHTLPHADGSASYTCQGYTIHGAVNGPTEPQRRDELPEEAFLEVNVRPATGAGGTRDRTLETLLHRALDCIIHSSALPRTLIQVTLQIISTPSSGVTPVPQAESYLPPLPHLLHAAVLALLNANIPLLNTCTAVFVGVPRGEVVGESGTAGLAGTRSGHVFAYAATGECLLSESEGEFRVQEFMAAAEMAEEMCLGTLDGAGRRGHGVGSLQGWLRGVIAEDVERAGRWRGML